MVNEFQAKNALSQGGVTDFSSLYLGVIGESFGRVEECS